MSLNLWAVLAAAFAEFIVGAIWYMPLFGRIWSKIHGFENYSKAEQGMRQKQMMPMLTIQFAAGAITAFVLAYLASALPHENIYKLAVWVWIGFAVPTQVGAGLFGDTKPGWLLKKIAIMAGGALACYMVAAFVISLFP